MSSCTECHGMAGEKYDDHGSFDCPRLKNQTPNNTDIDSGWLYELVDSFLVEAKDQNGNERSLERLNQDRHLFVGAVTAHITKAVADARKCQGCGISNSYCDKCERLLQT